MNLFTRVAFFTVVRDTGFVTLAAVTLMVGLSFEPALAFKAGATVALVFSVGLLARAGLLSEERLLRSEVWRALPPEQRPASERERRRALAELQELLLRFAKDAAAIAGILYGSALALAVA